MIKKTRRPKQRGTSLIVFVGIAATLIVFLGIAVFLSLQALLQHELQQAASNASRAGAAYYYGGVSVNNRPLRDSGIAIDIATRTFNNIIARSSALKGLGARMTGAPAINTANDSLTVKAEVAFPTPFLTFIGIEDIEIRTSETSRAVKYNPTQFTGELTIPPGKAALIDMEFPAIDTPGVEVVVLQDDVNAYEQGYILEACNNGNCYDLGAGASPIKNGPIPGKNISRPQGRILTGEVAFFFDRSNVNKATKLRVSNANMNAYEIEDLIINQISVYGFSSACVNETNCPIPTGFVTASQ